MQLELDWAQRSRCALRTDVSLVEIGVPAMQRAVIRLLLEHPDAQVIDKERKIVTLSISYREAARWMRRNFVDLCTSRSHPSSVQRALRAWQKLGAVQILTCPRTTIAAHFGRLAEWHESEQERLQEEIRQWAGVAWCPKALPAVAKRRASMNERMNEYTHSFIHSLPKRAFERALKGPALLSEIDVWWSSISEDDLGGVSREDAIGAILAARDGAGGDPHRYVERCLSRGLIYKWQKAAQELIAACANEVEASAVANRARHKKPKHKNILRELQQGSGGEESNWSTNQDD